MSYNYLDNYSDSNFNGNIINNNGQSQYKYVPPNSNKTTFDPVSHSMNVQRRIMERGDFFNYDTKHNKYKQNDNDYDGDYNDDHDNNIGEITGKMYNSSTMDQGMPLRGFLDEEKINVPSVEQQQNMFNPQLDFDLYHSKPKINVSYYDPTNVETSGNNIFSNVNADNQLLEPIDRIDPEKKLSTSINLFSLNTLNKFHELLENKNILILSPFSILSTLSVLYRGSHGTTEKEMAKFLLYPKKSDCIDLFSKLCNKMIIHPNVIATSFIFVPNNLALNTGFVNYVSDIGKLVKFDITKPRQEAYNINNIIGQYSRGLIAQITDDNLINANTNIILISTMYFRNKWKYGFLQKNTQYRYFFGFKQKKVKMMHQYNNIYNYYEDGMNQIIELDYIGNKYTMGIILPRKNGKLHVSHEQLEYYLSQLIPTKINELSIPKFKQQSRFKIDNLFKKNGMKEIFTNADFSEITPSNNILYISDIIHQSIIVVDENGNLNSNLNNSGNSKSSKTNFIANHPFIYYIRFIPTNTLLMVGFYY